jgi:Arc/MetJ family transcription regulator
MTLTNYLRATGTGQNRKTVNIHLRTERAAHHLALLPDSSNLKFPSSCSKCRSVACEGGEVLKPTIPTDNIDIDDGAGATALMS